LDEGAGEEGEETPEAKRQRILEETRDIDADSDGAGSDDSEEDRLVELVMIRSLMAVK
jgi:protein CWC15